MKTVLKQDYILACVIDTGKSEGGPKRGSKMYLDIIVCSVLYSATRTKVKRDKGKCDICLPWKIKDGTRTIMKDMKFSRPKEPASARYSPMQFFLISEQMLLLYILLLSHIKLRIIVLKFK